MKTPTKLVIFMAFASILKLSAQSFIQADDTTLAQVYERYKDLPVDTSEDSGYIKYQRFKAFWELRLPADKNLKLYYDTYKDFFQTFSHQGKSQNTTNWGGPWLDLGPHNTPASETMSIGRLERVAIDPDDATGNTIYVSSMTGGIFKTTDGGQNWINYYTDYFFGTTSVTDIRIVKEPAPPYTKYLYAAVGGDPEGIPFNGIYRMQIGSGVWQNLTSNLPSLSSQPIIVNELLIDPTNLYKMYLATNNGVYYTCGPAGSCNSTITWSKVSNFNTAVRGIEFDYGDPTYNTLWFSGKNVWRTTNVTSGSVLGNCITPWLCGAYLWNGLVGIPNNIKAAFPIDPNTQNPVVPNIDYVNIATSPHPSRAGKLYMYVTYNNSFGQLIEYDPLLTAPANFKLLYTTYNPQHNDIFVKVSPYQPNLVVFPYQTLYGGALGIYDLNNNTIITRGIGHDDTHDFDFSQTKLFGTCDGGISAISTPFGSNNFIRINGNGMGISRITYHSIAEKTDNDALLGLFDNGTKRTINLNNPAGNAWTGVYWGDGGQCLFLNNMDYYYSWQGDHYYNEAPGIFNKSTGHPCQNWSLELFLSGFKNVNGTKEIYHKGTDVEYNYDPAVSNSCGNGALGWRVLSNLNQLHLQPTNYCTNSAVNDIAVSNDNKTIYATFVNRDVGYPTTPCYTNNQVQNFQVVWTSTTGGINHPYVNPPCTSNCWKPLGSESSLSLIGQPSAVCLNPNDPKEVWVGCSGYYDSNYPAKNRRIIHSTDGGNTFTDFSAGLPPFPVNKIIFRNGTDYEIFAATDIGVYFRSKTTTTWQRVGTNLPYVMTRDLQINNCNQKLYAGTYGRGLWSINLPPQSNAVPMPTVTITQTVTISGTQYYFHCIQVPYGCKLIINNANIYMGPKTSIIVAPGGQLEINNSTLQSFCDNNMWHGIQVKGNPAVGLNYDPVNLFYPDHGTLKMNNSTIKDADMAAVCLGSYNTLTSLYYSNEGGGFAFADNSTFTNNNIDLDFWPYPYKNVSYARLCTLQVTGQLKNTSILPVARISAEGISGLNVLGCTFQNTAPAVVNNGIKGNGISSVNSYYLVANYCNPLQCFSNPNSGTGTVIKNFLYGIYATGTGSQLKTVTVRNTTFDNNYRGTFMQGINYGSVWRCTYTVPLGNLNVNISPNNNASYGLYFNGCSNFFCENNTFTGLGTTPSNNIGCVVNNSTYNGSRIFNCDFTSLGVGSAAYYDNFDNMNNQGLRLNCDKYTGNKYDIVVLPFNSPFTDIDIIQGYMSSLPNTFVRNLYSANCAVNNQSQYYVSKTSTMPIIHINHATQSGNGGTFNTTPCATNPIVNVLSMPGNFTRNNSSCPPVNPVSGNVVSTSNNGNLSDLNNSMSTLRSQYVSENTPLADGSSRNLIQTARTSSNFSSLKATMLTYSPYLSDSVLMTYFGRTGVPSQDIVDIHEQNAPVTPDVWNFLIDLHLPGYVTSQLESHQSASDYSERTAQQGIVSDILGNLQISANSKIRTLLMDTTLTGINDSILETLDHAYFSDADLKKVNYYIDIENFAQASTALTDIRSHKPYLATWCDFKTLQIQLLQDPLGYRKLATNTVLKNQMVSYADPSNVACNEAEAILKNGTEMILWEETLLPEETSERAQAGTNSVVKAKFQELNVILNPVPNPASNEVTIHYKLPEEASSGWIEVVDVIGHVIYQTEVINSLQHVVVPTEKWAAGMYYLSLKLNKQVIESKPLLIAK